MTDYYAALLVAMILPSLLVQLSLVLPDGARARRVVPCLKGYEVR